MKDRKTYSQDFKDKLILEVEATGNLTEVASRNGLSKSTLSDWVNKKNGHNPKADKAQVKRLEKELHKKTVEIEILKELLKKTNQAWLKD